jgi:hypothetical protein
MDAVVSVLNGDAKIFHNTTQNGNHWILLKLSGTKSNRMGIGAKIRLTAADGSVQYNHATTSTGYASSSDSRVHFGLGANAVAKEIQISWPSGIKQVLRDVAADRVVTVTEPHAGKDVSSICGAAYPGCGGGGSPRVAGSGDTIGVRVLVVDSADEAARILLQLKNGADFAALAREKSTDATSVDGGFLGQVDPATLRPELRDALHGLRPGELSRVVKLPSGYAILKVVTEAGSASPDSASRARQAALSAAGSVRYGPDVADSRRHGRPSRRFPSRTAGTRTRKPFAKSIPARTPPSWIGSITCWRRRVRAASTVEERGAARSRADSHAKGQLYAYKGEMAKAIEQWETAYRMASSDAPQMLPTLEESLGILYLHASEMENDVYRNPGEMPVPDESGVAV